MKDLYLEEKEIDTCDVCDSKESYKDLNLSNNPATGELVILCNTCCIKELDATLEAIADQQEKHRMELTPESVKEDRKEAMFLANQD